MKFDDGDITAAHETPPTESGIKPFLDLPTSFSDSACRRRTWKFHPVAAVLYMPRLLPAPLDDSTEVRHFELAPPAMTLRADINRFS